MVGAVQSKTPNYGFNRVRFDSQGWHTLEHENWSLVDSLLASVGSVPGNRGAWANSVLYAAGDRVADPDTGTIYRNTVTHTSASSGTFAGDRILHPTYWTAISILPLYTGQWQTGTSYSTQDIVRQGNAYYLCTVAHVASVFANDLTAMFWALIFDLTDGLAAQAAAAASATAAAASQGAAAGSANAASVSAASASTFATGSYNQAVASAGYANDSATYAATALTRANSATASASAASGSATAAQTARTGAETAQTGAQSARTGAESARDTAQGYRDQVNPTNFYAKADADNKFVPFDAAKALTVAQQRQAQTNIGALTLVKYASAKQAAYSALAGQFPIDDTIPQISEGSTLLGLSYTPLRVGNRLRIRAIVSAGGNSSGVLALFKNGAADAVAAQLVTVSTYDQLLFEYEETVASLSAISFELRGGMATGGGSFYINGNASNRLFGGILASYLFAEEFNV